MGQMGQLTGRHQAAAVKVGGRVLMAQHTILDCTQLSMNARLACKALLHVDMGASAACCLQS